MKEVRNTLPQIDAIADFNPSPEYANYLLDRCLKYYTLDQISAHTRICRRSLSYMRHRGVGTYPMQLTLEVFADIKVFEDRAA